MSITPYNSRGVNPALKEISVTDYPESLLPFFFLIDFLLFDLFLFRILLFFVLLHYSYFNCLSIRVSTSESLAGRVNNSDIIGEISSSRDEKGKKKCDNCCRDHTANYIHSLCVQIIHVTWEWFWTQYVPIRLILLQWYLRKSVIVTNIFLNELPAICCDK